MCNKVTYNLYMDESGKSGNNIAYKEQPYFIYSGWLLQNDYVSEARKIANIISKGGKENKSNKYFETDEFLTLFKKMIDDCIAHPFIEVVNKKFIIVTHIVTIYFNFSDKLNEYHKNSEKYSKLKKLQDDIANFIYDNIVQNFWNIIYDKSTKKYNENISYETDFTEIQNYLLDLFERKGAKKIYKYLHGYRISNNIELKIKESVNYFLENMLLKFLIRIQEEIEYNSKLYRKNIEVCIYHDSLNELDRIIEYINKYKKNHLQYIDLKVSRVDSKCDSLIQLSDHTCRFFWTQMFKINKSRDLLDNIKEIIFKYFINKKKKESKGIINFTPYSNDIKFLNKLGINTNFYNYNINDIDKRFSNFINSCF